MNQESGPVRQRVERPYVPARATLFLCLIVLLFVVACSKKAEPPASTETAKPQTAAAPAAGPISSPDEPPAASGSIDFPKAFGRRTGDLDEMAKNRNIRALVLLNPIAFFYDKGHPKGVMYEIG